MHLCRFTDPEGNTHFGIDRGDGRADLLGANPLHAAAQPSGESATIARRLIPVVPPNIFCIGLNYRQHAEEMGSQLPDHPVVFMKPTTAACDPGSPIHIPRCSGRHGQEVDYECELAVVIGRQARNVSEQQAMNYVLGYTCANDVSARWWQKHGGGGQWVRGKGFDTFCPLGPVIVTADEIPDPQSLAITTRLNGETMQASRTGDMIFSVASLIAFLSQDVTLLPGTVILTGTPSGVGMGRDPRVWLTPGDEVEIEIEKIGVLKNPVAAAE